MRSALFLGRDPIKAKLPAVVSIPKEGLVAMLSCESSSQLSFREKYNGSWRWLVPYLDKNWNTMHGRPHDSFPSLLIKPLSLFEERLLWRCADDSMKVSVVGLDLLQIGLNQLDARHFRILQ